MLYYIRVKKYKKIIEKTLLSNKFNYDEGETYQLDKNTSLHEHNLYCFSAHSYEKRQSLYIKVDIKKEYTNLWIYYVEGNHEYILEENVYINNMPLKLIKENDVWNIKFSGLLKKNNKDQVRCTIDAQFISDKIPYDNIEQIDSTHISKSLAQEKISDDDMRLLERKENNYYQKGVMKGRMLLEGQHIMLNIPCCRERDYGIKDWNYMNNHFKLMAINDAKQLNFSMVSVPAMSIFEYGSYINEQNDMHKVTGCKYEREYLLKGVIPENINLLMQLDNKEQIGVHIKKVFGFSYEVLNYDYKFIIGIAEFLIDGKQYRGIIEVGYNNIRQRWFNSKEVKKFRNVGMNK